MARNSLTQKALLDKVFSEDELDLLREGVRRFLHEVMREEVAQIVGAAAYERTPERATYRNGTRPRELKTRVGSIELEIPKLRQGSYFPSFLTPRRPWERALVSVIQEAYINGVSTRKVDRLVEAMGLGGCSKDTVSRLCRELDEMAAEFRNRPLEGVHPYLWLDARYEKVRENGRVRSMALVTAYAVNEEGYRSVIGVSVDIAESYEGWKEFLKHLRGRGLAGVKLVISDAHEGLKLAIQEVFPEASWQRCRVHLMRNILSSVPKHARSMVSALVRMIFAEQNQEDARIRLREVADKLKERFEKAAQCLEDAEDDVLAFMRFPVAHWSKISSTNPLERVNREIERRTAVVGIFPDRQSLLRLTSCFLQEQNDEWVMERRYMSQGSLSPLYGRALPASGKIAA
jgi:putative transposase